MGHYCLATGLPCIYCSAGACENRSDTKNIRETLKKDRGCVRCEHVIECKGKPKGVTMCINFKERGGKNEKMLR